MSDLKIIPYTPANWYEAITGKPFSSRRALSPAREAIVQDYADKLGGHITSEFECVEFSQAFSAVLDMYGDYLDAAYDLDDHEIDEVCFRTDMPRHGFDRYVEIAKLQKKVPGEVKLGQMQGKKWASDPAILKAAGMIR